MATKTKPSANGTLTEVFTLAQAAAFLQVSESALKADVDLGRVPAKCVGGEWRFSRIAILAWLAEPPKDSRSSKDRILETAGIW